MAMKVLISVRLDPKVRNQLEALALHRQTGLSSVVQELLDVSIADRHPFEKLKVAPLVCSLCQTHRGSIRHLTDYEVEMLKGQMIADGTYHDAAAKQ